MVLQLGSNPDPLGICGSKPRAAEYVPMMGKVSQASSVLSQKCGADTCNVTTDNWITDKWLPSGVRYMLGYNEPDGHEGGKCTPAAAATFCLSLSSSCVK